MMDYDLTNCPSLSLKPICTSDGKFNVRDLRIKISVVRSAVARVQWNKVGRDKPDQMIAGSHHQGRKKIANQLL